MGNYIAHKRRKIRHPGPDASGSDARQTEAIERAFARRCETERFEEERRRAAKVVRALRRRLERRNTVVDGASGRRHAQCRSHDRRAIWRFASACSYEAGWRV
jgi:hypothetical protein